MVLEETCFCHRYRRRRIESGWSHLSHHGGSVGTGCRLWLGYPDLGVLDPGSPCRWQPHCQVAAPTEPEGYKFGSLYQANGRGALSPDNHRVVLILPGFVLTYQLHSTAGKQPRNVDIPEQLPHPHPERGQVCVLIYSSAVVYTC